MSLHLTIWKQVNISDACKTWRLRGMKKTVLGKIYSLDVNTQSVGFLGIQHRRMLLPVRPAVYRSDRLSRHPASLSSYFHNWSFDCPYQVLPNHWITLSPRGACIEWACSSFRKMHLIALNLQRSSAINVAVYGTTAVNSLSDEFLPNWCSPIILSLRLTRQFLGTKESRNCSCTWKCYRAFKTGWYWQSYIHLLHAIVFCRPLVASVSSCR